MRRNQKPFQALFIAGALLIGAGCQSLRPSPSLGEGPIMPPPTLSERPPTGTEDHDGAWILVGFLLEFFGPWLACR